jgi:hypothetical protein
MEQGTVKKELMEYDGAKYASNVELSALSQSFAKAE